MINPDISVIMGIYNTKNREYLEKAIKSILNQTYNNFEFIICDDGSTNDSLKWAMDICRGDNRVVFIKNDRNRGLSYTLNHCLSIAKGKYIARMDDDDYSHKERFDKQISILKNNPEIDLVSCNINLFDEKGIYNQKKYPEYIKNKDFLFNSPIVHPAVMAKKKSFEIVDGYRDQKETVRVEDYDLFMRMKEKNVKMYVIQECLFDYRDDRENSIRRKKYKYRINEFFVRINGFKNLNLMPIGFIYAIKPLIVGLIPISVIRKIKEKI